MDQFASKEFTTLDLDTPVWNHVFTVAPLVLIGTKEEEGYNLAPKHMAMPMGWGNYFGFVCTPSHGTYQNIKTTAEFTVSFPRPGQIVTTSLSASPRREEISKTLGTVNTLPIQAANTVDAPLLKDAYLYLECELFKIIDGFDQNSIITGKIKRAQVHKEYLRLSEKDEGEQLLRNPLLVYIAHGRFAEVSETYAFPFPKDFVK